MRAAGVVLLLVAGCAVSPTRLPYVGDLDTFLAAHPLASGQNVRADEIGRTAGASYHVVQVRGGENPHRHMTHDLIVFVLRGSGTLDLAAGQRRPLAAGDAAVVPRGHVHWFTREGRAPAVALVTFVPPLDGADAVPAEVR